MLENLRIVNFKSHKDTNIVLKNLTVLCGQNGVGKSSLIQSLLLLRQSHLKTRINEILDLNDPLCYIGKTKDAFYQFSSKEKSEEISFILKDSKAEYSWIFDATKESTFLKRINTISSSEGYENLSLFKNNFQYISAARNSDYQVDDYSVEVQKQLSIKEGKGELTAQFLYKYQKNLKVIGDLKHSTEKDDFLLSQTTAWEKETRLSLLGQNVFANKKSEIKIFR